MHDTAANTKYEPQTCDVLPKVKSVRQKKLIVPHERNGHTGTHTTATSKQKSHKLTTHRKQKKKKNDHTRGKEKKGQHSATFFSSQPPLTQFPSVEIRAPLTRPLPPPLNYPFLTHRNTRLPRWYLLAASARRGDRVEPIGGAQTHDD